jgi:hypothetical protein
MTNPEPANAQQSETAATSEMTPEALAMLGKARRSFGISIGILLLGFMAIGFALVYRVMRDSPPPQVVAEVNLPVGAEVISALNLDGTIQVTYRAGEATMLSVFSAESGELTRSIQIGKE